MATNSRLHSETKHIDRMFNYLHGLNIITATADPKEASATSTIATQHTRAALVPVIRGDTISTLATFTTGAGTAVTLFKFGVWDNKGVLLAGSADVKANLSANTWAAGDITPVSGSGTLTFDYSGVAFFGYTSVATTTSPTFAVLPALSNAALGTLPASGAQLSMDQGSTSDTPATLTLGTGSATVPVIIGY